MIDESLRVDAVPVGWQPRLGDRVRVRLSLECRVTWGGYVDTVGHPLLFDGMTGSIAGLSDRSDLPEQTRRTHPYRVLFDLEVWIDGQWWDSSTFAMAELEPLTWARE